MILHVDLECIDWRTSESSSRLSSCRGMGPAAKLSPTVSSRPQVAALEYMGNAGTIWLFHDQSAFDRWFVKPSQSAFAGGIISACLNQCLNDSGLICGTASLESLWSTVSEG